MGPIYRKDRHIGLVIKHREIAQRKIQALIEN